jgi:GcrA cell cycle regulator
LWLEGKSASQVARQIGGVSRNAVIGKVHRMGLAGRDRPTAPQVIGRTARRPFTAGQSSPIPRPRPAHLPPAPAPSRLPGPELTVTASILTLASHECRWPIGDPQEAAFGYCGRPRGGHVSYCDHHAGVAAPKSSARRGVSGLIRLFDQAAAADRHPSAFPVAS